MNFLINILRKYLPDTVKIKLKKKYFNITKGGVQVIDSGNNNKIIIGDNSDLRGSKIIFRGNNNNILIKGECRLWHAEIQLIDDSNSLTVENNNDWGENVKIIIEEGTNVNIGKSCQIGSNTIIRTSDGHSIIDDNTQRRVNPAADIVLGDMCWLGEGVTILKGSVIDSNSIIGTASVVTKGCYDGNAVYVGIPARLIKKECHWEAQRI